jgi:hypothetical protein
VVAPVNAVPVITTEVPPDVLPDVGLRPVIDGAGMVYVTWSAEEVEEFPLGVVTVT